MNKQPDKNCPNKEPHECNNNGCNCHNNGKCCHAVEVFVSPTHDTLPEKKEEQHNAIQLDNGMFAIAWDIRCDVCKAGKKHAIGEYYLDELPLISPAHDQIQWKKSFRRRFKEEITERPKDTSFLSMEAFIIETLQHLHDEIMDKKTEHWVDVVTVSDLQAIFTRYGIKN